MKTGALAAFKFYNKKKTLVRSSKFGTVRGRPCPDVLMLPSQPSVNCRD
jgi:hypothetical protein